MSTREDSESTEFAEGVDSAPWEEVDMWLSLIVEYLGGGAMLISPSESAKEKGEICQFLSCISKFFFILQSYLSFATGIKIYNYSSNKISKTWIQISHL